MWCKRCVPCDHPVCAVRKSASQAAHETGATEAGDRRGMNAVESLRGATTTSHLEQVLIERVAEAAERDRLCYRLARRSVVTAHPPEHEQSHTNKQTYKQTPIQQERPSTCAIRVAACPRARRRSGDSHRHVTAARTPMARLASDAPVSVRSVFWGQWRVGRSDRRPNSPSRFASGLSTSYSRMAASA